MNLVMQIDFRILPIGQYFNTSVYSSQSFYTQMHSSDRHVQVLFHTITST